MNIGKLAWYIWYCGNVLGVESTFCHVSSYIEALGFASPAVEATSILLPDDSMMSCSSCTNKSCSHVASASMGSIDFAL
jgi:hypothetical protein